MMLHRPTQTPGRLIGTAISSPSAPGFSASVVELHIEQGAAIHAIDALGRTALRRAVRQESYTSYDFCEISLITSSHYTRPTLNAFPNSSPSRNEH
jgi:hypothetical protein